MGFSLDSPFPASHVGTALNSCTRGVVSVQSSGQAPIVPLRTQWRAVEEL